MAEFNNLYSSGHGELIILKMIKKKTILILISALIFSYCHKSTTDRSTFELVTGIAAVNGTKLYYEIQGKGHPLVLLEGGQLDLKMWDDQFSEFSQNYQVIRYDLRGFGRSGKWGASYQAHEDLRALLDTLAIEQAHLVGLSGGGRIAIDFALEYPERVSSLVLAGPGLSGFNWSSNDWFTPILEAMLEGDSIRAAELWLESPYMVPAMEQDELAGRLRNLAVENARVWAHLDTKEAPLSPPAVGRLDELRAPTLLIVGSRDISGIHKIVKLFLDADIPDVRRVIFEGSGHMVNMEQPELFNKVLMDFLKGH
jgi:pimeloyl-ACP methyl ester carboxylesterase